MFHLVPMQKMTASTKLKMLAPWKNSCNKQCIKKQRHHFDNKGIVSATVFAVVIYRCESWTINKAECTKIGIFKC